MSVQGKPSNEAGQLLLVDDDPKILLFLTRALTNTELNVAVAHTGAEALELLGKQHFDVVVSDIQMPGISGLKLLRAVREYDLDLPIVLMTGQPNIAGATAAVEYGAFQYLIKPVGVDRLRAVVARAVSSGRIARLKRRCVEEYGSGTFQVGDRAGIEAKLDRALRSLWMAYQPIVQASGLAYGFEALLRCEEPVLPHPGAVLKAAERVRRTHDVGRAVRDLVAADIQRAADDGTVLFVNLHPEDLLDPMLYLPTAPLTRLASRVVFELTDRATLDDVKDVRVRIERLRSLGFRIALDDLGAGEAGLGTFNQLEPEFVKLDMSLVRGADRDHSKIKMIESLVSLCHDMGKTVIAEGVETSAERTALVNAGCDLLQGYLFGRPGPFLDQDRRELAQHVA